MAGTSGGIPQWAGVRNGSSCRGAEGPLSGLLRALWYPRLILPVWEGAGGFLTRPPTVSSHVPSKSPALEVPKLALACLLFFMLCSLVIVSLAPSLLPYSPPPLTVWLSHYLINAMPVGTRLYPLLAHSRCFVDV